MLGMARFGTRDVARAKAFYDAIAKALGARRVLDRKGVVGYTGREGGMFLVGKPIEGEASAGNGSQVGLLAPSRAAVDAAYARAIQLGGTCLGPPGPRGDPAIGRYAAYFRDPDGNKIMVFRVDPA